MTDKKNTQDVDATVPAVRKNSVQKGQPIKGRTWFLVTLASIVVVAVLLWGFATNWTFTPAPEPEPAPVIPVPGLVQDALTQEEEQELIDNAEPGDGLVEVLDATNTAAGWALTLGVVNLSETEGDYTLSAYNTEGELLGEDDPVTVPPLGVVTITFYLPQDFVSGSDVELRLHGELQDTIVHTETLTVGVPEQEEG